MSILGNCPKCGKPFVGRRRCWKCPPHNRERDGEEGVVEINLGRRANLVADPAPEVVAEVEALKAEIPTRTPIGPENRIDKRELLRQAMAERAQAERERTRSERSGVAPPVFAKAPAVEFEAAPVPAGVPAPVLPKRIEPPRAGLEAASAEGPVPDAEIFAITTIFDTLRPLDEEARDRVLVYIRERFSCGF